MRLIPSCDAMKKPVFAYDKLFANFGAALIILADIATMGKQAAKTANNILHNASSKNNNRSDIEKWLNELSRYLEKVEVVYV